MGGLGQAFDHVDGRRQQVFAGRRRALGEAGDIAADAVQAVVEEGEQAVHVGRDLADLVVGLFLDMRLEVAAQGMLHGILDGVGGIGNRAQQTAQQDDDKQHEETDRTGNAGHREQGLFAQRLDRHGHADRTEHGAFLDMVALQTVRRAARRGDIGNGAAEDRFVTVVDDVEMRLAFLEDAPFGIVGHRFDAEPLAELLFDLGRADDTRRLQALHFEHALEKAFAAVDHAIDHRFRQMYAHDLAGRPDMFGCRGNRKAAEGIQADGNQHGEQSRRDADEKEGDFGV